MTILCTLAFGALLGAINGIIQVRTGLPCTHTIQQSWQTTGHVAVTVAMEIDDGVGLGPFSS